MLAMTNLIGRGLVWVRNGHSPYSVYDLRDGDEVAATFKMVLKPGHLRAKGECAEGDWGLVSRHGGYVFRLGGEDSGRPVQEQVYEHHAGSARWIGPGGLAFTFDEQPESLLGGAWQWQLVPDVPEGSDALLVYRGPAPSRYQTVPSCGLSINPGARDLQSVSGLVILGFMLVLTSNYLPLP